MTGICGDKVLRTIDKVLRTKGHIPRGQMWRLCVLPLGALLIKYGDKCGDYVCFLWKHCYFKYKNKNANNHENRVMCLGGRNEVCDRYMRQKAERR